jgi:hypothetical protein
MRKEEAERSLSPGKQRSSHKKKRPHSANGTASKKNWNQMNNESYD